MIKVFTTDEDPNNAGNKLTDMYQRWLVTLGHDIEIINIHTNSNKFGWMLTIHYKLL